MGALASYVVQSALVMTMLYLAYKWLMASTTFHTLNRFALLGIYAASWGLPLLMPLLEWHAAASAPLTVVALEPLPLGIAVAPEESSVNWWRMGVGIWVAGVAVAAAFSLTGMVRMWRILRSGERTRRDAYIMVVTTAAPGPFSWGRHIVLRPEDCDGDMGMVVAHEEAHLRRLHWLDLVVAQFTVVLQWFSPAAWLMMRELKTVHEFQVDREVAGDDPAAYQMMLLKKTVGSSFPTFADSLNHSQIKIRITMMMTRKSRPSRMAAALALPAMAALAVMTLSQPAVADVVGRISSVKAVDRSEPRLKVTKSSSSAQAQAPGAGLQVSMAVAAPTVSETPVGAPAQAQTRDEKTMEAKEKKLAIFVDGKEYKGELTSIDPNSIASMQVVKDDPAYPDFKIMITTKKGAGSEEGQKVYEARIIADQIAEYKGGVTALVAFLNENIKYPAEAKAAGVSGRVIVSFTIGADGSVSDVKVRKGVDEALDAEAVRVVKLTSGQWEPASNDGVPVATVFTLPVTFKTN